MRYFLYIIIFLWATGTCARADQEIRVNIIDDARSLSVKLNGPFELIDCSTGKVRHRGEDLRSTATIFNGSIGIAGKYYDLPCMIIRTENDAAVSINGRVFRGDIKLVRTEWGHLRVINQIGLEDYVKGILYHEVSHYWPDEALKAQAIVCRTYAIYRIQERKTKDFDVTSDIYSQVYGGKTSERFRTSKAVDDTRGRVLMYRNKAFPAFFHATCGGHTEDAALVWDVDLPPLKGVVCPYCKDSPHFNWHEVMPLADLKQKLAENKYSVGQITDIKANGRDPSGRVIDVVLIGDKKILTIPVKDFRTSIGPNIIRSTNFTVTIADTDAVFEGIGWGHGVGLCQWGAYFMAKEGKTCSEILTFYYPGTDVKTF